MFMKCIHLISTRIIFPLFFSNPHGNPNPHSDSTLIFQVLLAPIDVANFNQRKWMGGATDIIAIERTLAEKMKLRWLPWTPNQ